MCSWSKESGRTSGTATIAVWGEVLYSSAAERVPYSGISDLYRQLTVILPNSDSSLQLLCHLRKGNGYGFQVQRRRRSVSSGLPKLAGEESAPRLAGRRRTTRS